MKIAAFVLASAFIVLPLAAQSETALQREAEEKLLDISGIGFVLGDGSKDVEPIMIKIGARIVTAFEETDSITLENFHIEKAAMRYGYTTYFLDVFELDFSNLSAYIQPISVNEYNQTVLGDRIGELNLKLSPFMGLPGGEGKLHFKGVDHKVLFYSTEVTNTFSRWVEIL